jgi:myo-inositol-1(or 4)-monophosphatase
VKDVPVTLPAAAPSDRSRTDVVALLALAEHAARRAGAVTVSERPRDLGVAATKSSPTDVVTEMDRRAESLLREILSAARPGDAILGEEAGHEPGETGGGTGGTGLTWVVDPIDGTVNYLYEVGVYAVSVAVVEGDPTVDGAWTSVAGCVHNPVSGETWTAGRGVGAFLDGRRLAVAEPPALDRALTGTGFGYFAGRRRTQARVLAELLPRVRDIRRIGCAAIDLCMVATGRLDAYFERGLHAWDMAAASLVVEEAGGVVRGIGGKPPSEAMVVAAARPLVDVLAQALEELDADGDAEPPPGGDA